MATAEPTPLERDRVADHAFGLGSLLVAFVGVGHLAFAEVAPRFAATNPEVAALEDAMSRVHPIEGTSHTAADFATANSITMGIALLAFGALALVLGRSFRRYALPVPRSIVAIAAVATWTWFGIAVRFYPVPPVVTLGLASVAYSASLFLFPRARSES